MVARQRLSEPIGPDVNHRIQRLERTPLLGSSSITRGRLRVASEDGILVETVPGGLPGLRVSGVQLVDGTLRVTGALDGTGDFEWSGPWKFDSGDGEIAGSVDMTGILTVLSDLIVSGAGKIKVGTMVIDPANGGSVTFPGGAVIKAGSGGGVELTHGSYSAVVTSGGASIGKSGRAVAVTDAVGFQFVGLPTTSGKGVPPGTLWADGTGIVYRATS